MPATSTLPLQSAAAAIPGFAGVPAQARFWAIYTSGLHGECTPQTLQNMLNISQVDAKKYISQLIGEGVIKPNPIIQRTVSNVLTRNEDSVLDRFKKRVEMKGQVASRELKVSNAIEEDEGLDSEFEMLDDFSDVEAENESQEAEVQASEEPKTQV